jgi:Xaa-Pro dipeptidase
LIFTKFFVIIVNLSQLTNLIKGNLMEIKEKIKRLQETIAKQDQSLNGWLLYDFRRCNDLACEVLEIPKEQLLSRRFFYWIPVNGDPCKIVHAIEDKSLSHLPGHVITYRTWQELEASLADVLKGIRKIAMEYSPRNALPSISKVDAGTIEMIRSIGIEVISSANLLQSTISQWDESKFKSHLDAADVLCKVVEQVWELLKNSLKEEKYLTEYAIQQFMLERFIYHGCETSDAPICAVNENSSNPHYVPSREQSTLIKPGDFILIDLWCKKKRQDAVYADITRVGIAANRPTDRHAEIFQIVREAQKIATSFVAESFKLNQPVTGWEVDQQCRNYIQKKGYGNYFIHRTGHNIDTNDHGNGAHIDNYETHDDRVLLPRTCFSIEPGIYLPGEFGVRLEHDVYIHSDHTIQITGGEQNEIICL